MIRKLRVTDLPRELLPGGLDPVDLASTRAQMGTNANRLTPLRLARWSIASGGPHTLAEIRGGKIRALAVLRPRRGPRAWEVAHLFTSGGPSDQVQPLLESAGAHVSAHGGERLFLRVPHESGVQEHARRAGFFPAFTEEVFSLGRPLSGDLHAPAFDMRPPLPADTYGLFRLYNAVFPSSVRAASGLTVDQWADAREPASGAVREYVWEYNGQVRGWLHFEHKHEALTVGAMLHPDHEGNAPLLVRQAALLARGHSRPLWVVPSFQPAIGRALRDKGWDSTATYAVLIRSAAVRIEEPALMPAQA